MLTKDEIDELERLHLEATPGGWSAYKAGILHGPTWVVWNFSDETGRIMRDEDGELITYVRNLLPRIIAALREKS